MTLLPPSTLVDDYKFYMSVDRIDDFVHESISDGSIPPLPIFIEDFRMELSDIAG